MTRPLHWVVTLLVALSLALAACGKEAVRRPDDNGAIDETLLAYLSTARVLHHEADMAEDRKDVPAALAAMERLVAKPRPRPSPEIDEVLADAHARLADFRSQLGHFDVALKDVEAGLAFAPDVSYFRGHLLEVRGLVEERRAKALAAANDTAGASKAREAAMKAYEEAIAVQDEVIKRGPRDAGEKK